MRPFFIFVALLSFGAIAKSTAGDTNKSSPVSGKDVLTQMESILLNDSFAKAPAERTLSTINKAVLLNKLQTSIAEAKIGQSKQNSMGEAFIEEGEKKFRDLREAVCKDYPGMVVDLDGQLKYCGK